MTEWCKYCGEGDGVCERCRLRAELAFAQSQRDDNENAWQCEKKKREAAEAERDGLLREGLRWADEMDAMGERLTRYQRLLQRQAQASLSAGPA